MSGDARDPSYFDELYAGDPDPWRFETSDYERAKYAETIAALPARHYVSAVEIGCSIGVLTEQLATRAADVLGIDVAQAALDRASVRCAALPNVRFTCGRVPETMPTGRFDLVILSEVLYYFDTTTLARLASELRRIAAGDLVLVHWLGPTPDYPLTGDAAVEAFLVECRQWASVTRQERRGDYRLDVLHVGPKAR